MERVIGHILVVHRGCSASPSDTQFCWLRPNAGYSANGYSTDNGNDCHHSHICVGRAPDWPGLLRRCGVPRSRLGCCPVACPAQTPMSRLNPNEGASSSRADGSQHRLNPGFRSLTFFMKKVIHAHRLWFNDMSLMNTEKPWKRTSQIQSRSV